MDTQYQMDQIDKACNNRDLDALKQIYQENPDSINFWAESIFRLSCELTYFPIAKWIYEIKPDINISTNDDMPFRCACTRGLEFAKWLYERKPDINISAQNEEAFRNACEFGHLDLAQWLYQIKPDINISADDDYALRCASDGDTGGDPAIMEWILQIKGNKGN
jgi:hypothetical protein